MAISTATTPHEDRLHISTEPHIVTTTDIPVSIQKTAPTILVWDTIDVGEETSSGHGATHHTLGNLIQESPDVLQSAGNKQESANPGFIFVNPCPLPSGPAIHVVVAGQILDRLYAKFHHLTHLLDMAYIFVKFVDGGEQKRPGWTGFNTQQHNRDELNLSHVSYFPTIMY